MRHRIVLAAWIAAIAICAAVTTTQARAGTHGSGLTTTIGEPIGSHHPYQRWADEALIPIWPGPTQITEGDCEEEQFDDQGNLVSLSLPGAVACSDGVTIEMVVTHREDRKTFYHELGHIWDANVLTDAIRHRFLQLINQPHLPWWEPESVSEEVLLAQWWGAEKFADTYAVCAFRSRFGRGTLYRIGNLLAGPKEMRRSCRLIRQSR